MRSRARPACPRPPTCAASATYPATTSSTAPCHPACHPTPCSPCRSASAPSCPATSRTCRCMPPMHQSSLPRCRTVLTRTTRQLSRTGGADGPRLDEDLVASLSRLTPGVVSFSLSFRAWAVGVAVSHTTLLLFLAIAHHGTAPRNHSSWTCRSASAKAVGVRRCLRQGGCMPCSVATHARMDASVSRSVVYL